MHGLKATTMKLFYFPVYCLVSTQHLYPFLSTYTNSSPPVYNPPFLSPRRHCLSQSRPWLLATGYCLLASGYWLIFSLTSLQQHSPFSHCWLSNSPSPTDITFSPNPHPHPNPPSSLPHFTLITPSTQPSPLSASLPIHQAKNLPLLTTSPTPQSLTS